MQNVRSLFLKKCFFHFWQELSFYCAKQRDKQKLESKAELTLIYSARNNWCLTTIVAVVDAGFVGL